MATGRWFDFYWARIARWCCLGTIVMFLWLMAPVVRCSWAAFRDTPIGEVEPETAEPGDADSGRLDEGRGFWNTFTGSVNQCYRATPLLGQESWKRQLLIGFAAATILTWLLGRIAARRRRTFTP